MQSLRHRLLNAAVGTLILTAASWLSAAPQTAAPQKKAAAKAVSSPLKLTVDSTAFAAKFVAYVGGGANISPPDTVGGGGGVPLISFSDNGPAFMAGEVSARTGHLLKIMLTVANPAQQAASFKIGDITLITGSQRWNDFAAVGYGSKLCAMGDADRKKVKEILVTVPPGEDRSLSYAFPIGADAKRGELVLGNSAPVPFEVVSTPEK